MKLQVQVIVPPVVLQVENPVTWIDASTVPITDKERLCRRLLCAKANNRGVIPHQVHPETSNRVSSNDRRKIHNKIREGKKKKAKAAKKNTQWKSKHKKDPGIPNNYPYKEQVLAEIEEQRRLAAEDKEKRKALRKAAKTQAQTDEHVGSEEEDQAEGVSTLPAKRLKSKVIEAARPAETEDIEMEDVPLLLNHDLPSLKSVLDASDVVIQVLDSRDPPSFRSAHLEELLKEKKLISLLNKIDACPQQAVAGWLNELWRDFPTFLFRSASAFLPQTQPSNDKGKGKGKEPVTDAVGVQKLLDYLHELAAAKVDEENLTVAIVGLTNVGKSSVINSLLKTRTLPVYTQASSSRGPSTTEFPQEVYLQSKGGKKIRFIDTPGLLWEVDSSDSTENSASNRVKDVLLRNRGRIERVKDPMPLLEYIVTHSTVEDLMLLYNLPTFARGNVDAFIAGVARSQQLVKKRGVLDLGGACRNVLRDWNTGKIKWSSVPATSSSTAEEQEQEDKEILSTLLSRKELRLSGGFVKFTSGSVEKRKLALEQQYQSLHTGESSDDDDEEGEQSIEGGEDEDGNEDEDDEEDEDEAADEDEKEEETEPPVSAAKKRKRSAQEKLPPAKKVSFAPPPPSSKAKTKPKSKSTATSKTDRKPAANTGARSSSNKQNAGEDSYDFGKFF